MLYQRVVVNGEDIFLPVNTEQLYMKCDMCGDMVEADFQEIVDACGGEIPVNFSTPCCAECAAKLKKNGFALVYNGAQNEEPDEVFDDE